MIEVTLYENDANIGTIEINDSDTFPLSLTKSNSDIRDITKRQGVYTKDFKVLATAKNNRFLKYIYNANATAIGGRDCSVSYNGMPILTGIIFAINIGQRNQADEYTLRIYSDNVDWYTLLGAATINSYDYGNSEVASFLLSSGQQSGILPASTTQSTLSRAYIEASWRFPSLFDYVYPLISYGQPTTGVTVTEVDMRPAIYIGKMLTKAFASIGYTLTSDFFSTGVGSKLILPFSGEAFVQNQQFVDDNSFTVGGNTTIASNVTQLRNSNFRLVNNLEYSDPSNINNSVTGLITIQESANYIFTAKGQIQINFNGQTNDVRLALSTFRVGLSNIFNQEVTYNGLPANTQSIDVAKGQTLILEYDFTTPPITLNTGATLDLFASIDIGNCTEYFTGNVLPFNVFWIGGNSTTGLSLNMIAEPLITANQTYVVSGVLKGTKVLDIIGGLQNIFNLYFETNNDARTVTIEPKPALMKPLSQGEDLTDKLDIENRITTDIIQAYNRSLQFQYATDSNDKWQQNYNQEQGTIYGSANYDLGGDFKDGVTNLGTKFFAATLLYDKHPFSLTSCAIPVMWNVNAPSPPKSYDFLPRILYYKGYERITLHTGVVCTWRWIDVIITNIPTSFMIDPDTVAPVSVNLLYNDSTNRNGLVRTYYNGDVAVISDRRVHKAYFQITGVDFRNLDLFKPIYLEHVNLQGWYYVNQVIDFTPNKNKTTIYELVKAFDTLPFDRPIVTEIPTIQGGTRQLSAIGGGTLTAGGKQSFESLVGFNGSGNVGIIRGGGTVLGNGNIQTESNQHIFGNYNFGNDSVWIIGIGESDGSRYNGLQLTPAGVFKVHGGTVRTIVNSTIQDVYATIGGNYETIHLLGNG